jgi:hypothetical protein
MGGPVPLQFAVLLILSHALEPITSNFLVDNLHVVTDFLPVNEKAYILWGPNFVNGLQVCMKRVLVLVSRKSFDT